MTDIDSYAAWTETMWFSGNGNEERDLVIMSLGLGGESGEVQEHIKKLIRDNNLDRDALKKEMGDVIFYWARLCKYFSFAPSEILAINVAKLNSRRERGVLRGDGDQR